MTIAFSTTDSTDDLISFGATSGVGSWIALNLQRRRDMRANATVRPLGFTLIELLVVIAIIAVLSQHTSARC
jgi:prepilin-type N-terminal cleavage/methylation domain-containing protein